MTKGIQNIIVKLLLSSILLISCEKKESFPPNIFILQPKTNAKVVKGNSIKISVFAKSDNDNIREVILFIDKQKTEIKNTQPYDFIWDTDDYIIGLHAIKAKAIDNSGLSSESEIKIEVIAYVTPTPLTDQRDGRTYEVAEIGEQVWMAENLRYENEFSKFVNNDKNNTEDYGLLYKTRLGTGQGVCPDEWHIPSRDDWSQLIEFLGGENVAGGKLKETGTLRWEEPNSGASNTSGFTARPAGSLTWNNLPEAYGSSARFFTSFYSNYIFIDFDAESLLIKIYHPSNEFYSIRCIRDY